MTGRFKPRPYSLSNPVNYTDPSGHIAEGAEDYYASWILADLKAKYNVRIDKDWGHQIIYPYPLGNDSGIVVPPPGSIGCEWQEGAWELRELSWVNDAIRATSRTLGGPDRFKTALGQVRITRWSGNLGPYEVGSFAPPFGSGAVGNVILTDEAFSSGEDYAKFTTAHELGHVWDHRTQHRLSQGLMEALGTWLCDATGCGWFPFAHQYDPQTDSIVAPEAAPGTQLGCSTRDIISGTNDCRAPYASTYGRTGSWATGPGWEDWAESFASLVYPNYYLSLPQPRTGLTSGGVRETYLRQQITRIP